MKRLMILAALFFFVVFPLEASRAKSVHVIKIDGIIDPGVADYVKSVIDQAEEDGSAAVVIELDTPGGMLDSTKDIVQAMLDSKVPVVVYVSPAGASATSAGMMITVAGHVAVMAPGTNIGAAHPVLMPFGVKYEPVPKEDVMMEKATKDTVGWVRSICEVRGRNADWAERAVTESESITAREAVEQNVADGVVKDLNELLDEFLPGRAVAMTAGNTVIMDTKDARIIRPEMTIPQKLQHLINNPNVILILLLLGGLGIALEFKNPGLIFPAVIGAGCILIALLAPSLPINYIGLVLIVLAFVFLFAEIFITSYGVLTVASIVALVVGSLMLFNTKEVPNISPSLLVIGPIVGFVVSVVLIFGAAILRVHRQKVMTGREQMVDAEAVAETDIGPDHGKIFVHGEYWNAVSDSAISKGDKVVIKSVDNLLCRVEALPGKAGSSPVETG